MSNFSEYIKNTSYKIDNDKKENKDISHKKLEDMINKYSGLGQEQLMNEFLKLTMEKKKKGELNTSELESIKSILKPMLNSEQNQSLNSIIEMVKNVK